MFGKREFEERNVPSVSQKSLSLQYKGKRLQQTYKPDFICFDTIIVEIKGVSVIVKEHVAQVLNYLKATELQPGLIINFGASPKVEIKRVRKRSVIYVLEAY